MAQQLSQKTPKDSKRRPIMKLTPVTTNTKMDAVLPFRLIWTYTVVHLNGLCIPNTSICHKLVVMAHKCSQNSLKDSNRRPVMKLTSVTTNTKMDAVLLFRLIWIYTVVHLNGLCKPNTVICHKLGVMAQNHSQNSPKDSKQRPVTKLTPVITNTNMGAVLLFRLIWTYTMVHLKGLCMPNTAIYRK